MAGVARLNSPLEKEGFICPICMQDLGSASALSGHFEVAHTHDGNDMFEHVKGFFGKAKRIFQLDPDDIVDKVIAKDQPGARLYYLSTPEEIQENGKTRNLTDIFKSVRDARIDKAAIDCNKIIVRLEKLTCDSVPEDKAKRKEYEKKIVPWQEDSQVSVCPTCNKKFSMTRGRHHCRLCGKIMCGPCSEFLPTAHAKLFKIPKNMSMSNSLIGQPLYIQPGESRSAQDLEKALRTCLDCRKLLELHKTKQEQKIKKPPIVELFEMLQENKRKLESISPEYIKMAQSLILGETTYSLQRASELRQQIAKLYNSMEAVSKKILNLEVDSEDSSRAVKLQLSIRAQTIAYIQEQTSQLPKIPDEKTYQMMVSKKEEDRKKKVELLLKKDVPSPVEKRHVNARKPDVHKAAATRNSIGTDGWKPGNVTPGYDDDPMIQQMNIIRGYLTQAKQAQKWDEVELLEENLKHLETEYYRQSKASS